MLRSTSRSLCLLLMLALAAPLVGCGPKKKKKSAERAAKAEARVVELMEERRKRLAAKIPTADEKGEDEHPWLAWIKEGVASTPATDLKEAAVKARRTPWASKAKALASWLEAQKKYYRSEDLPPNAYMREITTATKAVEGTPLEVDLAFEHVFIHAAQLATMHNLFWGGRQKRDDRVTRFFTFWKWIFDFKPETSILEDEVNKLCKAKLGDFCKDVPMESRVFRVMKPYWEGCAEKAEAFRKKYPGSAYDAFAGRIAKVFAAYAEKVPEYPEDPKLPAIRSTVSAPYTGNAALFVVERGVVLLDVPLRRKGDEAKPWDGDLTKPDPQLAKEVSMLMEDTRKNTTSTYSQSELFVVAEPDVSQGYITELLRGTIVGPTAKQWPRVNLVGRRRSDGSNLRAGFKLAVIDAERARTIKIDGPDGKQACTIWAAVGPEALDPAGFVGVVLHNGEQIHTGKIDPKGKVSGVQTAAPHGDGDRLEQWSALQQRSVLVAGKASNSYAQMLEMLNGVAIRCEMTDFQGKQEERCKKLSPVPVFVATCEG